MSLSELEPLPIDVLQVPNTLGQIGMSYCPGRWQPGSGLAMGQRNLKQDLERIRVWGGIAVVSLITESEFRTLGVPELGSAVREAGMQWFHAPIQDFSAPGSAFELAWNEASPALHDHLRHGQRILLHCRAGLGRTGTVAARLLVEFDMAPETALATVRRVRAGTVENEEQADYIRTLLDPPA